MQSTEFPDHLSHNSLPESATSSNLSNQMFLEDADQKPTVEAGMLQPEKTAPPNDYPRKRSNTTDASNAPKRPKPATNGSAKEPPLEIGTNHLLADTSSASEKRNSDGSKTPETQSESQPTDAAVEEIIRNEHGATVSFGTIGPADTCASQHTETMSPVPMVSQNVDTEPANPDHEVSASQTADLEDPSVTLSCESASGDTIVNTPVETLPEPGSCANMQSTREATPTSQELGSFGNPILLDGHDRGDVSSIIDGTDVAGNNKKVVRRQKPRKKTDNPSMVDWTSPSHKEELNREVQNKWILFLGYAYWVNPHWIRAPVEEAVRISLLYSGSLPLATARQLIDAVRPETKRKRRELRSVIDNEKNPNKRAKDELTLVRLNELTRSISQLDAAVTNREEVEIGMVEGSDDDDYMPRNRHRE